MSYNNVGHLMTCNIITLQHFATLHHTSPHYTSLHLLTLHKMTNTNYCEYSIKTPDDGQ